ncbi:DUF488 domain-containing protein [Sorangium sp. So ce269]
MRVYTIGFTKTSAERFFGRLKKAEVRALLDVRLNNVSQLAGFAKKDDLRYFTQEIVHAPYIYRPELAPTKDILDRYKKSGGSWDQYAQSFLDLMAVRRIETTMRPADLDGVCLLCSEDKPNHCHRRLVVEYLRDRWGDMEIVHL